MNMGLLDSVIGGVLGQVLGGGRGSQSGSSAMSPLVKALLMMLMAKGMNGGFSDILGRAGGRQPPSDEGQSYDAPQGRADEGDVGGFDQYGGGRSAPRQPPSGGGYGDLAGMLDGPGGGAAPSAGAGPYARLDHEPDDGGTDLGGLDGLAERFQRGGLGDVIGSWIGHGENRPVHPNQLAEALGPETVDTLSQKTGLDRDALLSQLVQVLPQVVDGLTPHGRMPNQAERWGW